MARAYPYGRQRKGAYPYGQTSNDSPSQDAQAAGVAVSWRWAAVPLAAAAGLGLFLLTSREAVRGPVPQGPATARIETSAQRAPSLEGNTAALSAEDREMLTLLDVLENPDDLDANDEADGMDLLVPGDSANPADPRRGGRSGA